jgi:hypothetical protein
MCVLPPGPPAPLCNDRRLHGTGLTDFSDSRAGQWNNTRQSERRFPADRSVGMHEAAGEQAGD